MTPVRLVISLAAVLLLSDSSFGQQAPRTRRTFEGAFGPTAVDRERPFRLDLTSSISEAPDDDTVLATQSGGSGPWYTGGAAALAAIRHRPHSELTFNLATAGRFYPVLSEVIPTRHSGAVAFDTSPGRDWRFQLSGGASYSPLYQAVFAPSTAASWAADPQLSGDAGVSRQRAMQYESAAGVTHNFNQEAELKLTHSGHYNQVLGAASDFYSQRAGAELHHALTRNYGIRLASAYGTSTVFADLTAVPVRSTDIDVAFESRGSAASPRTSFAVSVGSTMVSSLDGRQFRAIGSGRLLRRLSAQWTAALNYDRGLQVPDGATRPFFSDTVGALITGYLNHRVSLSAQPRYARGVVGLAGQTNSYDSYMSSARVDIAVNRRLALFTEHLIYHYQFDNGTVGLPIQLTSGMNRQTLRVGLTVWTPLVR